ncbi:MAG TPA: glycosyltransferase [Elusimicrobiota bacterium]|nr:glycosyltransferase [Elusimicrobiota bacterium]
MPGLIFLVTTYNALPALKRCLRSIEEWGRDIPHRIYIADDASRDGTRQHLRTISKRKKIHAYSPSRNIGKAALLNVLADRCAREPGWRVCLDDDAEITESWTRNLARHLPRYSSASIIGCRNIDHAGKIYSAELILGTGWGNGEYDIGQRNYTRFCDGVSGSCMLIREDVFRKIRFNETMRQQLEDTDFCFRVRRSGGKIIYCGKAWVRHEHLLRNAPFSMIARNKRILSPRQRTPSLPASHPIDILYKRILTHHNRKNWPAMLADSRQLAGIDPAPYYAQWLAGLALRKMDRQEEAFLWIKEALKARYLNPATRARMELALYGLHRTIQIV